MSTCQSRFVSPGAANANVTDPSPLSSQPIPRGLPRATAAAAALDEIPVEPLHEPPSSPLRICSTSSGADSPLITVMLPLPTSTLPPRAAVGTAFTTAVPLDGRSVTHTFGPVVARPHCTCRVGSSIASSVTENAPVELMGTSETANELKSAAKSRMNALTDQLPEPLSSVKFGTVPLNVTVFPAYEPSAWP